MGSSCISNQKDSLFEDVASVQINSKEKGIQGINQTIKANFQQVKVLKETLDEGIQISNIQTIVIRPRCESESAKIMSDLIKFGNQITIISKRMPDSPVSSMKSISKKGILKNKQEISVTKSADGDVFFPSLYRTSGKNIRFKG
ncbi:unnamed protein product (macronuclear) [Paramecium tetraurelia]|uniref:Uncharacterized protein n=1 Tax=Paramecium tetraurelia TaxID=5888 RepID=A0C8D4_PARTE|nr:uncharacterized protein GSPATT00036184001 [Paramecium tetraurelia]CAK67051.1 unnamed protein product [Paramecium tetraurelia]|eukprot:XP_001434448.1 hypothetical protein (macronuclear) [Paramecium tetraurelia strain d4-2]